MAVRVLLVLAALSMLLAACGEAAQESEPKPETTQEPKPEPTTPGPLEYGDPVELIGIPWSEPQQIDYEGRRVLRRGNASSVWRAAMAFRRLRS